MSVETANPAFGSGDSLSASGRSTRLALAAILLFGALVRAIGLGSPLWIDEVDSLLHCVRLPVGELLTSYPSENQHPLYSLCAHGCLAPWASSSKPLG